MDKPICQELNCTKEASEKLGNIHLCSDHYIAIAYDWQGLVLKKEAK